jgi:polar amino acid transport system permease protein
MLVRSHQPALRIVGQYLFHPDIVSGILVTVQFTVLGIVIGIVLAVMLGLMWLSVNPVLVILSSLDICLFCGIPQVLEIIF